MRSTGVPCRPPCANSCTAADINSSRRCLAGVLRRLARPSCTAASLVTVRSLFAPALLFAAVLLVAAASLITAANLAFAKKMVKYAQARRAAQRSHELRQPL